MADVRVLVWVREGTWPACVAAARMIAPESADIVLLCVLDEDVSAAAHGAYAGLLGRGRADHDPGAQLEKLAALSASALLHAAAERLGRPAERLVVHGRAEREVVAVAADVDLLVLARDGDPHRPGPHSIGHAGRFVVDHAACQVLLVWPG